MLLTAISTKSQRIGPVKHDYPRAQLDSTIRVRLEQQSAAITDYVRRVVHKLLRVLKRLRSSDSTA